MPVAAEAASTTGTYKGYNYTVTGYNYTSSAYGSIDWESTSSFAPYIQLSGEIRTTLGAYKSYAVGKSGFNLTYYPDTGYYVCKVVATGKINGYTVGTVVDY